jgi:hypothetical protein
MRPVLDVSNMIGFIFYNIHQAFLQGFCTEFLGRRINLEEIRKIIENNSKIKKH